ncbi:MAG: D-alanyl-D-alanine carboxypeptidase/D-alanyl-D-alanine-endopeptidase [Dactylosporangium sp.]|nr:D-alanyl-D-alanine carboxypeptidase/D-alanyl-D-alanine-endopeptidase [Dactylosporangium sp.]NNJ63240.1 D-alanyl-D-alanine carboxypeptidase/D-alanyl-D-alanine-endopeptidase [Dactylosporangium sp.]
MAGQKPQAEASGSAVPQSLASSVGRARVSAPPPAPRRRSRWGIAIGALVTIVAAAGAWAGAPLAARPWLGPPPDWHQGTPAPEPALVLASSSLEAPVPTSAGVSAAVSPLATAAGLGGHTAISIVDASTGQSLFSSKDTASVPASTAKIVTAATVLAARGPAYQITTKVFAGTKPGEVVLVGAGDPTLAAGPDGTYPGAARLDDLATQVRTALGGVAPARVVYDSSLFTGDVYGPGWDSDIPTGGYGAAVTALAVDGARVNSQSKNGAAQRYSKPDLAAAQAFAKALGLSGADVAAGTAEQGARELGQVHSPPLARVVELMLSESDNVIAEALARQVAIARGQPVTFVGAAAAMKSVLGELGLPTDGYDLADGSGLSRDNRLTASLLTSILSTAASQDNARLHAIFSGLPVAGYSGTLDERYLTTATGRSAAGNVRAKTGTLTGVNAIAGIVVDADGRLLAFAMIADATGDTTAAQQSLDRLVVAVAACGCR